MNRQSKIKRGILIVIMLACIIALIGATYSRYTSTGTATVTATVAKWSVKLGSEDISTEAKTINATFVYDSNDYVKDGRIAPGRSGYFDIEVDPTGSEVAVDYEFSINSVAIAQALEENSTSAIAITGATYTVFGGSATAANLTNSSTVAFTESLADVLDGKKVTVRVFIAWDNDSDANNESDTAEGIAAHAAGENGKTISIPVSVTAKQHI